MVFASSLCRGRKQPFSSLSVKAKPGRRKSARTRKGHRCCTKHPFGCTLNGSITHTAVRTPMFTITHQPTYNIVEAALSGFFDMDEFERYVAEVEPIIRRAARQPDSYLMLLDVSGCAIQSQVIMAAFQGHLANVPKARLCAVVTGSSIVRLQVRRVMGAPNLKMFESRENGLAWLIEGQASQAA